MEPIQVIMQLKELGFFLVVENEELVLKADRHKVTDQQIDLFKSESKLIDCIKDNKNKIIEYILRIGKTELSEDENNRISAIYRLSPLQEGLLFHGLYEKEMNPYLDQLECRLVNLQVEAFLASWQELLKRHTILRSGFHHKAFKLPVQYVYKSLPLPVVLLDWRDKSVTEQQFLLEEYRQADRAKGVDFEHPPLMRLTLINLQEQRYWLLWSFHHILVDGWSGQILMGELLEIYEQLLLGKALPAFQEDCYQDYIRYIERQSQEQQQQYWQEYLQEVKGPTLLPFIVKTANRNKQTGLYRQERLELSSEFSRQVSAYAKTERITLNTLMQGVWAYLLHAYTGNGQITYGVTVSGRPDDLERVEKRVGLYINTLPLHSRFDSDQGLVDWLQDLQQDQLASRRYQYSSLSQIQKYTSVTGDLFDTLLVFENYPVSKVIAARKWALQVEALQVEEKTNYPLTIAITTGEEITVRFDYNTALLETSQVKRIADHFHHVLKQMLTLGRGKLSQLSLLPDHERQLLVDFNQTQVDYPAHLTVVDLFQQQAARTPSAVALVFQDQQLTYHQLDLQSNQLAHYLRSLGVSQQMLVGICLERSLEMVVSILAILKAGAAYVPIDPAYPAERIAYMLADSAAPVLISSGEIAHKLAYSGSLVDLVQQGALIQQQSSQGLAGPQADELAYVIYTSGSTGRPKGVMIEHKSLLNLACSQLEALTLSPSSKVLQFASLSFDASCYEIFTSLLAGSKLIIATKEDILSAEALSKLISDCQIDVLTLPPSYQSVVSRVLKANTTLVSAGEPLKLALAKDLQAQGVRVVNAYGPTEGTVCMSMSSKPILDNNTITIGRPIANVQVYLLDSELRLVPLGVVGEIHIGGVQVARGYLNQAELTQQKFIANPFGEGRLYKTGDLGRWLEDGNLEYLGRMDEQVKLRGYRIELGEIEQVLQEHPQLKQCVVVLNPGAQTADGQPGEARLVAYLVSDAAVEMASLREYLLERLPEYMVPSAWVQLESIPLTSNGKVDRQSLTKRPVEAYSGQGYVAPRSELEQTLANIWQELLGVEQVGIYDNFFELGGHSLLAVRLVSAIRKHLHREVDLNQVFDYPILGDLAALLINQSAPSPDANVVRQTRPERIPLSFAQERLWFLDQLSGSQQYHVPAVLRLQGELNESALEQALRSIVNRHEVLRTVIEQHQGQAYQRVLEVDQWSLHTEPAAHYSEEHLQAYIQQLTHLPFDLAQDHKLRVNLLRIAEREQLLVVVLHHIASDGWSMPLLVSELVEGYNARVEHRLPQLPELPLQYADYALWQRQYLQGEVLDGQLAYWQQQLEGVIPLNLPTDFVRPAQRSNRGGVAHFQLDRELSQRLQQWSQQQGATLFMGLLSVFKLLLYRYSGQADICVGSPIANREQQEVEGLIGFFVNTLALRTRLQPEMKLSQLVEQVRQSTLSAYQHQQAPFEKVVEAVVKERDMSRNPLFEVMFTLQNNQRVEVDRHSLQGVDLSHYRSGHITSRFDLEFSLTQLGEGGLSLVVEYTTDLYKPSTIERLVGHYRNLLEAAVAGVDLPLSQLPLLSLAEERQLLVDFNQTQVDYPAHLTVVDLFQQQAARTPSAVALVFQDQQLTYHQLDLQSNQLAHYLRSLGVSQQMLVGICLERSLEMVISILAILKAGAAYVPIDPAYPAERIAYMLADSAAPVLISSGEIAHKLAYSGSLVDLVQQGALIQQQSSQGLAGPQADELAYVIYTSGSTGRPKGVMIEHQNLIRLFKTEKPIYTFTESDTWTLFHSFCFDFSVWEIFGALMYGGRLVIVPAYMTQESQAYCDLLIEQQVTVLNQTPSSFYVLQDYIIDKADKIALKMVIFGGEALNPTKLWLWKRAFPACQLINMYGITEITVHATYKELTSDLLEYNRSIIGSPIPTLSVYILDQEMNLLPLGVVGEIHIGGAGLARGYLNQAELTQQKFIANPFGEGRLYKTGDLGRWLEDGNLEYLGRMDEQVKLRGYRIELGEIEQVLQEHPQLKQCVVVLSPGAQTADGQPGEARLVAYLVSDAAVEMASLREYLLERLPEYMVPSAWVQLESIPLTSNGKVDRQSLTKRPVEAYSGQGYVAPRSELEQTLANIWQELLGLEQVGIHDNFFELGGHSLLATRVASAIRKKFDTELAVKEVFLYPTIQLLANHQQNLQPGLRLPVPKAGERPALLPLSFAQERLWFLDQLSGSQQYHVPAVLRLQGELNESALEQALRSIVNRHEVLRTVIEQHQGQAYQRVLEVDQWSLHTEPAAHYSEEHLQAYIQQLTHLPFDLAQDHKLRVNLLRIAEREQLLVVVLHHIASDGWSMPLLVSELVEGYNARVEHRLPQLPELPLQYADYALWQRQYLQGEVLDGQLAYWQQQLEGVIPLNLPTDFVRPAQRSNRGGVAHFQLDRELSQRLQQWSQQQGATLFMGLLSVFKLLLYRYSGQADICVGSPIANREQQEVEGLIGFFVNTLALRTRLQPEMKLSQLVEQVRQSTLSAYQHQQAPFEKVVEAVVKERDMSRNPLFEVMFILQNNQRVEVDRHSLQGVDLSHYRSGHITSRFDLEFSLTQLGEGGLSLVVEYTTDLYKPSTIERLVGHYRNLLEAAVAGVDLPLSQLPLLSLAEERQLLVDFNQTQVDYPAHLTVVDLFQQQAARTPSAVALVFQDQQLTYHQLDLQSNQLAHYLRSLGVSQQMLVGICLERSLEMVISILAILKAGAAYVPIDPAYPAERIAYMLADSAAPVLISSGEIAHKLAYSGSLVDLVQQGALIQQQSSQGLAGPQADELAYVIYTSGSTGRPKGVMIEHKSLFNRLYWAQKRYPLNFLDTVLQKTTYCFDVSVWELFSPLLAGAKLVLAQPDGQKDNHYLKNLIQQQHVTLVHFVPTMLEAFLLQVEKGQCASLRQVVASGEALKNSQVVLFNQKLPNVTLLNLYGPTEAAIEVSHWAASKEESVPELIPIGKPIANTQLLVFDSELRLVPLGVVGEIHIGGVQVARGYLNQAELTQQKFIANPFGEGRLYKTGDLGRWLEDGNLEYLGRMDEQVKLRGYRIELGEIENSLNKFEQVAGCCVVKYNHYQNDRLVCYYLPEEAYFLSEEQRLEQKQVHNWQTLYQSQYDLKNRLVQVNAEFDITTWNDSFSGQAIAHEQMQEWLDDIIEVILLGKPSSVLEIGCGTGMIYYRLAAHIKHYIGSDFSRACIEQITNRIAAADRYYPETSLQVCAAHEQNLPDDQSVDTIILNSVIQYFPSQQYLSQVIAKCIDLLKEGGRIIVGDVRDHRLLKLFKGRLMLAKAAGNLGLSEFSWDLDQQVLHEEELCVNPQYFYQLQSLYKRITHVNMEWKQGRYLNELTQYRYTVIISVGVEEQIFNPSWYSLHESSIAEIRPLKWVLDQIKQEQNSIALADVPNSRLKDEYILHQALQIQSQSTVEELRYFLESKEANLILKEYEQVDQIIAVAKASGYNCRLFVNNDPLKTNILFEKQRHEGFVQYASPVNSQAQIAQTNRPLFSEITTVLEQNIHKYLLNILPEYMIPNGFIALDALPLTPSGKVNRKLLSQSGFTYRQGSSGQGYVAPRSELEQALANIWQELLGLEQVGIHDNFFELGGHSLLATRVASAIRKKFDTELAVKEVFLYPTIQLLASHQQNLQPGLRLPVPKAGERPALLPLSFAQERLWFLDQLSGSQQYHVPAVLRLQGELNESALEQALRSIVNRHEVLRTVIEQHQGQAYQRVLEVDQWSLHTEPAAHYSEEHLQAYIQQLTHLPFDLAQDHKLRVNLLRIAEREQLLVVVLHHIASDGWSMPLLVSELVEGYNARVEHRLPQLPELPLQYADYALWQRQYLQGEVLDGQLAYWQQQLEGVIPLNLPTDFVRPAQRSNRGGVAHFQLDRELSQRLQQWSQQQGATLFMGLLSVFKLLLYRYSGQADICVGSSIANREQQEVEGLIGFFVNTLALRTRLQPEMKLSQLVEQVRQSTLSAYQHQQAPFEKVVEAVVKERDMSRNPLFEVMFTLQNNQRVEVDRHSLQGVDLSHYRSGHITSRFDLEFSLTQLGEGGLSLVVEYTTDLYKPSTIERLVGHYRNLLEAAVAGVDLPLSQLPLLSLAEERQLLVDFNQTQVDYPAHLTVVDLFQQQAARTPSAVALVFQDQQLTYHQLDLQSNQLAHYLRSLGVSQQMLVGICLERSLEMVVSILAILKAGAAYVPIDPAYPAERIAYMLADSAAPVLISSGEIAHKLAYSGSLVDLVQQGALIQQQSSQGLAGPQADELAYVIYTSGSTGRPKGVMIEHKSLLNYLLYAQSTYCQQPALQSDSLLLLSYCFDASLTSLFGPLLKGGCLRMAHPATQEQLLHQAELLAGAPYQFLKLTPAHLPLLEALLKESDQLLAHTLVVGGEVLSAAAVTPLLKQGIVRQVINEYGPTEATVGCSTYELPMSGQEPDLAKVHSGGLPIGKPIANGQIHLLDSELRLVPLGVVGEIHIGGVQVARGYLNQAELTQQKFIANPFGEGRLYKTGDLGRWLEDGNLEYLGRMDEQVKLRGYRIELGEIEQVLQEHPQLKQCVVVLSPGAQTADGQPGEARLVAYLVSDAAVEMASLREYLLERLPEYMVPSAWVQLESIPLTSNGKVDRQSLTKRPVEAYSGQGYVAPRSELEQTLANIWQELLGVEQVGIYDNFFELGGHSLLAVRLVSAIRKHLHREVDLNQVFDYPILGDLAALLINQSAPSPDANVVRQTRPERIPLSFAQERLWFLDQLSGSQQYHVPAVLRLQGELNESALEQALRSIVNRHEVLRTVIEQHQGQAYQRVLEVDQWSLHTEPAAHYSEEHLQAYIQQLTHLPFDLAQDHKLRVNLLRIAEREQLLVVVLHHIASDGWSMPLLVSELVEGYNARVEHRLPQLPELPLQYADYALWQRQYLQGEVLDGQLAYWQQQLEGVIPLNLPTDFVRPAQRSNRGGVAHFQLDRELSQRLQQWSQQQGATLFMGLLSVFKLLLYRYSGQADICVGSPIANREQQEVEGLIGFFVNTLALRTRLQPEMKLSQLVEQVRQSTLSAYQHQQAPFEKVVEAVVKERDMSRNPLFEVMFTLQNNQRVEVDRHSLQGVDLSHYRSGHITSRFDLEFSLTQLGEGGLSLVVEYTTDLYKPSTIERLVGHYRNLLEAAVAGVDLPLSQLPLLSLAEERQLLVDFNQTQVDYPAHLTVVDLFQQQAARTPSAVALISGNKHLTYQELNHRANQLAHYLSNYCDIQSNDLVGVLLDRSEDLVISILAILKAGAAYVPIDPTYPAERIRFMVEKSSLKALIIQQHLSPSIIDNVLSSPLETRPTNTTLVVSLSEVNNLINQQSELDLNRYIQGEDLIYMIYTSGSTGRPKGVMVKHSSFLNLLNWYDRELNLQKSAVVLLMAPMGFDLAQKNLFLPILKGASLCLAPKLQLDYSAIAETIARYGVTLLNVAPSAFYPLLDPNINDNYLKLSSLKTVVLGGEPINLPQLLEWSYSVHYQAKLLNSYGPTECTDVVSYYWIERQDLQEASSIPIGKPVDNTNLYVLNKKGQLLPIGVAGELYIGGVCVSKGYYGDQELTQQKFIANPFGEGRLYKTGDLGRWLEDGNLEYLGRMDEQVKLRGYRIELGEIEQVLQEHPQLKQCVVVLSPGAQTADGQPGEARLVAYLVSDAAVEMASLREYLLERLPEYMVPSAWVQLESIPLTSNGKVDRQSLTKRPVEAYSGQGYVAPRSELEQTLANIWQELLGVEQVGIHDNFFELGGHSLLAIKLLSEVQTSMALSIPLHRLFEFTNINDLSKYICLTNNLKYIEGQDHNDYDILDI